MNIQQTVDAANLKWNKADAATRKSCSLNRVSFLEVAVLAACLGLTSALCSLASTIGYLRHPSYVFCAATYSPSTRAVAASQALPPLPSSRSVYPEPHINQPFPSLFSPPPHWENQLTGCAVRICVANHKQPNVTMGCNVSLLLCGLTLSLQLLLLLLMLRAGTQ